MAATRERKHVVIDYMYLYFRYTYILMSGKLPRLSWDIDIGNGAPENFDISQVYYSLRDVELFRKRAEEGGHDVTVSVCFDSWSKRREDMEYKANRSNVLDESDNIRRHLARKIMRGIGYNVYKLHGYEADDLIYNLVKDTRESFDTTLIYTPDMDLAVNIRDDVSLMRYSTQMKGNQQQLISRENYEEVVGKFMKCSVPYNSIMLCKAIVGDTSDNISGVKGMGPASFNKIVNSELCRAWTPGNWASLYEADKVELALMALRNHNLLNDVQLEQAQKSLELVRPCKAGHGEIADPVFKPSKKARAEVFGEYGMKSLID